MTKLLTALLIAGLIFPALSLLTAVGSLLSHLRRQKHSSPLFLPLIGPIPLTIWVLLAHKALWMIALFWVTDLGTVAFLAASPRLIAEWWRTSSFTRILMLNGTHDEQKAVLTLHSTGHYLLKKFWSRPPGQIGIVGLSEPGTFTHNGSEFVLISHVGLRRILKTAESGAYHVDEDNIRDPKLLNYSLNGWILKAV